jgi:hypothetical protein
MGTAVALPIFAATSILGTASSFISANQQQKLASAEAEAAKRRTLFESESERRQRQDRLKRLRAAARASSASRGVAGVGGSAGAILDGLNSQGASAERDARRGTAFDLNDIELGRQSNLLQLTERRRRAAIGLLGDAGTFAGQADGIFSSNDPED